MSRARENQGFICINCGQEVLPLRNGSYRNHCPYCLYSLHVDIVPGDRACKCMGLMEPNRIVYNSKKGYQIVHRCLKSSKEKANIICDDDSQLDNFDLILEIMASV